MSEYSLPWGEFQSLEDWYHECKIEKRVMRLWLRERDGNFAERCDYVFIAQIIKLQDGDYLIGYMDYDFTRADKKYPYIDYVRLSDANFAYSEKDQEELEKVYQ